MDCVKPVVRLGTVASYSVYSSKPKGGLHALALLFGNKGTAKDAAVHFLLLVS